MDAGDGLKRGGNTDDGFYVGLPLLQVDGVVAKGSDNPELAEVFTSVRSLAMERLKVTSAMGSPALVPLVVLWIVAVRGWRWAF